MNRYSLALGLALPLFSARAATNISIDPDNKFAMVTISSNRAAPDAGPQTLFDGLAIDGDDFGSSGTRRGFDSPDKDIQVSCASVPMASFANCQVLVKAGPNATFSRDDKEVKYELKGEAAAALLPFFRVGPEGYFRMATDDKRFGLYADPTSFVIKAHPRDTNEEP